MRNFTDFDVFFYFVHSVIAYVEETFAVFKLPICESTAQVEQAIFTDGQSRR